MVTTAPVTVLPLTPMSPPAAFDHRDTGTAEHRWTADVRLCGAVPFVPAPGTNLVVLAAHPDDETLGAGGLLATAADLRLPITVVVASLGERSHPESPTHTPEALARLRRHEVLSAVRHLAPDADVRLLGLPDGALESHRADLATAVRPLLNRSSVVAAPWRGDRHPDHRAVGVTAHELAAAAGSDLLEYPIWAWHWADPDLDDLPRTGWVGVELTATTGERKRRALAAHVSQHEALSPDPGDAPVLTDRMLLHFRRPVELFLQTSAARIRPA